MIAIFKRELRAYFMLPLGYVFIGAAYFFTGFFFYTYNLLGATTDTSRLFGQLFTAVLFLIPVLTMRLLSEERRLKTDRQLFAAPVSIGAIVAGKYLSALLVYAGAISGSLLATAALSGYGRPDWPVAAGNYIGLFLLGGALIAVCMFISSLTESQFIAAVGGFAVGLVLLLLDAASLNMGSGAAQKLLFSVSFNNRYSPFTMGIFDFGAAIFFISVAALFIALTAASLEKRQSRAKPRFWAYVILLVASIPLLNAVVYELDDRYRLNADLTASSAYRLDQRSISILEGLDKPVDIYMLAVRRNFSGSPYMTQALNVMEQYPRYSPRLSFSLVDSAADPAFAARFSGRALDTGDMLVVCEGNVKQLKLADLFNFTLSPEGTSMVIGSSRAEEALTSAIVSAASPTATIAALLTGNAVKTPHEFISLIENNNYEIIDVNPVTQDLPEGAGLALLFGPGADYTDNELKKLDDFLYNSGQYGKTLLYTADPSRPPLPNIEAFLREWGVSVGDGAVYETDPNRTYQYVPFYPVADYADSYYRNMLADRATVFLMPMARHMELLFTFKDNNTAETLLGFGGSAVVRPSGAPPGFTADDAEIRGPLPALILASKRASNDAAAVSHTVVSASTDMLNEMCISSASLANGDYMLNLLNDLTGGGSAAINIAPKSLAGRNLAVPTRAANTLGTIFIGVIPACMLLSGFAVWLFRRHG